jgi:glycosyltransferase involved in cell wall biosynthesis
MAGGLGGSIRSLVTLLRGLEGVHRAVAAPDKWDFARFLDHEPIAEERITLPTGNRTTRISCATTLLKWVGRRKESLGCIHANSLADANVVVPAAAVHRVPVVVWVHDFEASTAVRLLAPAWRSVERLHFACVSEIARQVVEDVAPWAAASIVPNPIDPAEVVAADRPEHDPVVVGYLGGTLHYKGFQFLPDVVDRLADDRLVWRVFAGPRAWMAGTWDELRRRVENVTISERVEDVREAYRHCDIIVCPSLQESFGRVAAEAMLNGIPVVASDIPALRSLIGGAGILVPPGDSLAMAEAVRRLADDASLRHRMGAEARRRASEFDPPLIVEKMRRLYALDDR